MVSLEYLQPGNKHIDVWRVPPLRNIRRGVGEGGIEFEVV